MEIEKLIELLENEMAENILRRRYPNYTRDQRLAHAQGLLSGIRAEWISETEEERLDTGEIATNFALQDMAELPARGDRAMSSVPVDMWITCPYCKQKGANESNFQNVGDRRRRVTYQCRNDECALTFQTEEIAHWEVVRVYKRKPLTTKEEMLVQGKPVTSLKGRIMQMADGNMSRGVVENGE